MKKIFHVIAACSGWGAKLRGCEKGPEELLSLNIIEKLRGEGIRIDGVEMLYPKIHAHERTIPASLSLPLIYEFNLRLYDAVKKAIANQTFPIVLGGDHSIAVGTWNSFPESFGLLWVDAHMDAHTPLDSPSGAYHGMPVAALLGKGAPEMVELVKGESHLQPENLAYIGVRSFEKEEAVFLKEKGVRIYFMEEVRERGLNEVIPEAIDYITRNVARYGVSLDLDVFDMEEAPGVGSPEVNGMKQKEMIPLLQLFGRDPRLIGFELVEYNPERDIQHKTANLAYTILYEVMK